jgi:hypothetical protein
MCRPSFYGAKPKSWPKRGGGAFHADDTWPTDELAAWDEGYTDWTAQYADGRQEPVGVTNPLFIEIAGRDTTEECLVLGDEVLIGQTVLEKTDLLVDCANQCVMPNPAHPDEPVLKIK